MCLIYKKHINFCRKRGLKWPCFISIILMHIGQFYQHRIIKFIEWENDNKRKPYDSNLKGKSILFLVLLDDFETFVNKYC